MEEVSIIGLDLAKRIFQAHGADRSGKCLFSRKLSRAQLLGFFSSQKPCIVAMEACSSAHYWGREIAALGHEVRLIPAHYVKPYVKRGKNDAADAEGPLMAVQGQIDDVLAAVDRFFSVNFLQLRSSTCRIQRGWNQRHQMNKSVVGMPGC